MFKATINPGLQIRFANGYTASIQFGPSNYCDRIDRDSASSVECAAWDDDGKFVEMWPEQKDPTYMGWMNPKEVLEFLNKVEAL